jgi:GST-like protein
MIDLYTWGTPNGRKVSVMLEECGMPYRVHTVNIGKDEQFKPEFLAINPNNRIPAIVDPEGPDGKPLQLFESILVYLSRSGQVPPASDCGKWIALQWLMFQMAAWGR